MDRWSALLVDLVKKIEGNLNEYADKIRFRCVCTHWQSTSPELLNFRDPQPPLLLLPYKNGSMCGLYHPFENKVFDIDLPEAGEKVFKGSGHGWVVTQQLDGSINVVNPLSRVLVPLPPRHKFPDVLKYRANKIGHEYLIVDDPSLSCKKNVPPYTVDSARMRNDNLEKIVLSCSPTSKDFVAVAHYTYHRLAYWKVGDKKWRDLVDVRECPCLDVTFCDGKLYVLYYQVIYVCDDIVSCPKLRKCGTFPPIIEDGPCNYNLANLSDKCLVVVRRDFGIRNFIRTEGGHRKIEGSSVFDSRTIDTSLLFTSGFEVFKLDMGSSSWVCMKSLGDEILYMSKGTQMGISSQNYRGSKGNRIYFAVSDHFNYRLEDVEDCFDIGVFSREDKKIKSLDYECNSKVVWPSPIWFTPNPY